MSTWNKGKYFLEIVFYFSTLSPSRLRQFLYCCISLMIPGLYNSLPCFLNYKMTAALQLSSLSKYDPPNQSFSPGNAWQSEVARSDEYVRCGKTDYWESFNTEVIRHAVWSQALLCQMQILFWKLLTAFVLYFFPWSYRFIEIWVLGDRFMFSSLFFCGKVFEQEWPLSVPKESKHDHTCQQHHFKLFQSWFVFCLPHIDHYFNSGM